MAWHLWRESLREELDEEAKGKAADSKPAASDAPVAASVPGQDRLTLWVVALEEYALPNRVQDDSLLVPQSLLLHGGLTHEQLLHTLPFTGSYNTVSGLMAAGIVQLSEGGELQCTPQAYPAIRRGLEQAGFPVAAI